MKSNRTWAEFHAQGVMLGMYYDGSDHTFMVDRTGIDVPLLDADTMETLGVFGNGELNNTIRKREGEVNAGLLGASDWLDTLARNYFNQYDTEEELMRNARPSERPDHG